MRTFSLRQERSGFVPQVLALESYGVSRYIHGEWVVKEAWVPIISSSLISMIRLVPIRLPFKWEPPKVGRRFMMAWKCSPIWSLLVTSHWRSMHVTPSLKECRQLLWKMSMEPWDQLVTQGFSLVTKHQRQHLSMVSDAVPLLKADVYFSVIRLAFAKSSSQLPTHFLPMSSSWSLLMEQKQQLGNGLVTSG